MARNFNGGSHRRCSSEKFEVSDRLCLGMQEFHVLAVDDSFVDRMVIERLLKISSCKVTVVESGTRALQFLGLDEENSVGSNGLDLKVNLIITDYSMPGMTGYELLKRIKESSTFRKVPVVIMSSENILNRIERCLEEGAKEYIVKPVKLSDVKRLKEFILLGGEGGGDRHSASTSTSRLKQTAQLEQKTHKNVSSPQPKSQSQSQSSHNSSAKTTTMASSSSSSSSSSSIDCIVKPLFLGFSCSSPACLCVSSRLRFRSRSSKYSHSEWHIQRF